MKKTLSKILGIIISLILVSQNLSVYAITQSDIDKLGEEQSNTSDKIDELQQQQEELESNKSVAMKAVENLISQISDVQNEIDELSDNISSLEEQIEQSEKDIEQKTEEYNEQEALLDARVISLYKSGETSYLEIFLTSSSITDFLSKYYLAEELMEQDKAFMEEVTQQKAELEAEKEELEDAKKELKTALTQQEAKKVSLTELKEQKEEYAEQLTEEEEELAKEIEELEEANRQIEKEIKAAEATLAKQLAELNKQGNTSTGSGYFIKPVASGSISARAYYSSGKFHGAIDYAVPEGTVVMAAADGVVMSTNDLTYSYGTYVVIRHANGLQTYYAHGTKGSITVTVGQTVKQGDKIMLSGNTGKSTGAHLHFEVRVSPYSYSSSATAYGQDSRVNPLNYL